MCRFNAYFNIKKMIQEKRRYKQYMTRVCKLPEDYQYIYKKIQSHMWMFAAGNGYDMLQVQYDLLELFEEGVIVGKQVLEITGEDVAAFCEDLLRNTSTYTENWREKLNRDISKKLHSNPKGKTS